MVVKQGNPSAHAWRNIPARAGIGRNNAGIESVVRHSVRYHPDGLDVIVQDVHRIAAVLSKANLKLIVAIPQCYRLRRCVAVGHRYPFGLELGT